MPIYVRINKYPSHIVDPKRLESLETTTKVIYELQ